MGKIHTALSKAGAEEPTTRQMEETPAPPLPMPGSARPTAKERRPERPAPQATAEGQRWDERLDAASSVLTGIAESFRRLRATILHPKKGQPARTIMVTSSVPSEGKSFVCANLGIAFAQGVEEHALLIDCDLRRPALAQLFGLGNDRGLVNHLRGGDDLGGLIKKTSLDKLAIIPAGPPPMNPSELLGSEVMQALITEVSGRYPDRFIFFDSPPLQAASETSVLAKQVDGIVLVVRWGRSGRKQVQQLVETLGKEKILGVVFNACETGRLESKLQGYSHGYDYYYTSGYGRKD